MGKKKKVGSPIARLRYRLHLGVNPEYYHDADLAILGYSLSQGLYPYKGKKSIEARSRINAGVIISPVQARQLRSNLAVERMAEIRRARLARRAHDAQITADKHMGEYARAVDDHATPAIAAINPDFKEHRRQARIRREKRQAIGAAIRADKRRQYWYGKTLKQKAAHEGRKLALGAFGVGMLTAGALAVSAQNEVSVRAAHDQAEVAKNRQIEAAVAADQARMNTESRRALYLGDVNRAYDDVTGHSNRFLNGQRGWIATPDAVMNAVFKGVSAAYMNSDSGPLSFEQMAGYVGATAAGESGFSLYAESNKGYVGMLQSYDTYVLILASYINTPQFEALGDSTLAIKPMLQQLIGSATLDANPKENYQLIGRLWDAVPADAEAAARKTLLKSQIIDALKGQDGAALQSFAYSINTMDILNRADVKAFLAASTDKESDRAIILTGFHVAGNDAALIMENRGRNQRITPQTTTMNARMMANPKYFMTGRSLATYAQAWRNFQSEADGARNLERSFTTLGRYYRGWHMSDADARAIEKDVNPALMKLVDGRREAAWNEPARSTPDGPVIAAAYVPGG